MKAANIIQCGQCQTIEDGETVFGIGKFILFGDIPAERCPDRQCPQCRARLSDYDWVALDPTDVIFSPPVTSPSPQRITPERPRHGSRSIRQPNSTGIKRKQKMK